MGDNIWHHIVSLRRNDTTFLYVDGVKINDNTTLVPYFNNSIFIIGHTGFTPNNPPVNGDQYFNGDIDDVCLYNRALSDTEIQALYNSQNTYLWSTGDTIASITVSPSQTTTYWVTQDGCTDSVTITVLPTTFDSSYTTACGSYIWNGVTYDSTGLYMQTFTNMAGCDSVHTLNLTILSAPLFTINSGPLTTPFPCNGYAIIIPSSVNAPYTYQWSTSGLSFSTNDSIMNLCAGWYVYTVTDTSGCSITDSVEIVFVPCDVELSCSQWQIVFQDDFNSTPFGTEWSAQYAVTAIPCPPLAPTTITP
jgi:hypothetical protein